MILDLGRINDGGFAPGNIVSRIV
ncbi:hypothetical protein cgR_1292 [Corynebacterium glutamicum R]|uniref:Uncharacterized protein n=1 Tax=Corynebacterium glutamicum (strain R) TaxID=340322 RepID=A0AB72VAJ2_CORGB|nr:hypothetical protein cgR_1292 [Corynebacterium glutamicum R]